MNSSSRFGMFARREGGAGSPPPAASGALGTPRPASSRPHLTGPSCARLAGMALALLLAGCATEKPRSGPPPQGTEAARLYETDLQFSARAQMLGVANAFREFLAERAILLPNGELPVEGLEAIYEHQRAAGEVQLAWEPVGAEVARSGELGYTWGFYEVRARQPDGTVRTGHGKYTSIWEKQPDGQWKVILDTGNPGPPPPPAQPSRRNPE